MYIFVQRQEFSLQASPLPNPFKIYCWRFVRRNAVSKAVVWFDFFFSSLVFLALGVRCSKNIMFIMFCHFFFFKHLIPFLIETRQEESLIWEKTGLKLILSVWYVFLLQIWGWPVPLTSKNFPQSGYFKLKNGSFPCAESQVKVAGSMQWWTWSFWLNWVPIVEAGTDHSGVMQTLTVQLRKAKKATNKPECYHCSVRVVSWGEAENRCLQKRTCGTADLLVSPWSLGTLWSS